MAEHLICKSGKKEINWDVSTVCPHCGNRVTLDPIGDDINIDGNFVGGQRVCPNPKCHGHIFIVRTGCDIVYQYPPLRISFEKEDIPLTILKTFDEAITCHSEKCYIASAIMIRRTLEEVCEERGAKGKDLSDRIKDLQSKIVLPKELLEAMDELRLLGNDAAHIEAKTYKDISEDEINVAITFTIEILKALYQYSTLLDKMRSLKKTKP